MCVSALRVCSFRGWAGQRVLSATTESRLHPNSKPYVSEDTSTHSGLCSEFNSDTLLEAHTDTNTESQADTHMNTHLQQHPECEVTQVHDGPVRTKLSKIISYRVNTHTNTHTLLFIISLQKVKNLFLRPSYNNFIFPWTHTHDVQGRITGVQDAEAGLYKIDGEMLLCLAYQPLWKGGGGLRPGAEIEVSVMDECQVS